MKRRIPLLLVFLAVTGAYRGSAQEAKTRSFTVDVQGTGKPVILIPGLACSAEVWRETAAHLNAEGYQTHALTLAGFGGSKPIGTDHFLASVRDDLAAYIKQNHLDHPVIIGHSLGGFLALWVAEENPDLMGKVISVDGLPYLAAVINPAMTPEGAQQMAANIRQGIANSSEQQYEAQAQQTVANMVTSPQNVAREVKVDLSSDRASVGEAMSEMMTTDIRPALPKISVPVLVLGSWIAYKGYGATHESTLASYQKQFENARKVTIVLSDTSKHFIQLDAPDWFYAQVDAFLK